MTRMMIRCAGVSRPYRSPDNQRLLPLTIPRSEERVHDRAASGQVRRPLPSRFRGHPCLVLVTARTLGEFWYCGPQGSKRLDHRPDPRRVLSQELDDRGPFVDDQPKRFADVGAAAPDALEADASLDEPDELEDGQEAHLVG